MKNEVVALLQAEKEKEVAEVAAKFDSLIASVQALDEVGVSPEASDLQKQVSDLQAEKADLQAQLAAVQELLSKDEDKISKASADLQP